MGDSRGYPRGFSDYTFRIREYGAFLCIAGITPERNGRRPVFLSLFFAEMDREGEE
jgi:hypothetical protein